LDSLEWSRTYVVLNISRLLLSSLGFSPEQITSLSEEDMQIIADTLNELYGAEFAEHVRFHTDMQLVERRHVRGDGLLSSGSLSE